MCIFFNDSSTICSLKCSHYFVNPLHTIQTHWRNVFNDFICLQALCPAKLRFTAFCIISVSELQLASSVSLILLRYFYKADRHSPLSGMQIFRKAFNPSLCESIFLEKFDKQQPTFSVYFQTVAACCLGDVAKSLKLERGHDLSDHLERRESYQDLTKTTVLIFLVSEKHVEWTQMKKKKKKLRTGPVFLRRNSSVNLDVDSDKIKIENTSEFLWLMTSWFREYKILVLYNTGNYAA